MIRPPIQFIFEARRRAVLAGAWLFLAAGATDEARAAGQLDPIIPQLEQIGRNEAMVMADAELEPAVAAPGEPVLLRMVVTAHSESAAPPETLPLPAGLSYRPGGTMMTMAMMGQGIQFRTTFLGWITAREPGDYTIPGFAISANSRMVPVPPQRLRVVPAGSPELAAARAVRLEASLPARDYYVGQKVWATVTALDSEDNSIFGLTAVKGEGNDFIFDDGGGQQNRSLRNVGGRMVSVLSDRMSAVPVKEGDLSLVVQAVLICRPGRHLQEVLPGYQPLMESQPVTVKVKHLPPGELPGFTGLIGHFTMEAPQPQAPSGRVGEPLELVVTVHGDGNLDRLVPPKAGNDRDWQVVPATVDSLPAQLITMRQTTSFRYTLVPRQPGQLMTPRIPFSYFDPDRVAYVDLTIPPVALPVEPPPGGMWVDPDTNAVATADAAGVKPLPELAPKPEHFADGGTPVSERGAFWLVQAVLVAGLLGLVAWDERRRYLAAHPEVVRRARARRALRRQEAQMREAVARGDATQFVVAAVGALREAGAPEVMAEPQALVGEDVLRTLPPELASAEVATLVRGLFLALERWQYRGEAPLAPEVFSRRAELDRLLEALRRRLC